MLSTAIIVFREVLEAAIIIGIVSAATRDVRGRKLWLTAGIVLGLLGSGLVAASTGLIASLASGVGQELFNASVLGVAVLMLAWHNVWMASHGAQLASHARNVGAKISEGRSECSILLVVVGLAVLREGSETVLFLYGISASAATGANSMLFGGLLRHISWYRCRVHALRWSVAHSHALVLCRYRGASHVTSGRYGFKCSTFFNSSRCSSKSSITFMGYLCTIVRAQHIGHVVT